LGRQFTRPDSRSVSLGTTTKAKVLAQYGQPYSTGQFTKHNVLIDSVHYYYGAQQGMSNWILKKHCWFYFVGDRLMAYSFVTGFPEEQRDFAAARVAGIIKGKTARAEVIAVFGEPNGVFQYPVTEEKRTVEGDSMIQYGFHSRTGDSAFSDKFLQVIFDANNIAKEVDFDADEKSAESVHSADPYSSPTFRGR
jgi:hypothetical protein